MGDAREIRRFRPRFLRSKKGEGEARSQLVRQDPVLLLIQEHRVKYYAGASSVSTNK